MVKYLLGRITPRIMKQKLIIHTASLYYWFEPYEAHLDDRIHAALDAGLDGVEISNGPAIATWKPNRDTTRRLKDKTATLHAEFSDHLKLPELAKIIKALPFAIQNVVIHPDELPQDELKTLIDFPYPVSIENMDSRNPQWKTDKSLRPLTRKLGFCYDTAHAMENGLGLKDFSVTPNETHLSIPNFGNFYDEWGWKTYHALTQFAPDKFPEITSSCPIITLEGLVPPDPDMLQDEIAFVKERLR